MNIRGNEISYGPTLARLMGPSEILAHLQHRDGNRVVGVVYVPVSKSHVPNRLDIDAHIEDLPPADAIAALRVAASRLEFIHKLMPLPPAAQLGDPSHAAAQHRAEQLVDMCRSSRLIKMPTLHSFDHSRDHCVTQVIAAIVRGVKG